MIRPDRPPARQHLREGQREGETERGGRGREEEEENDGNCHYEGVGGLIKTRRVFWTKPDEAPHKWRRTAGSHLTHSAHKKTQNISFCLSLAIDT